MTFSCQLTHCKKNPQPLLVALTKIDKTCFCFALFLSPLAIDISYTTFPFMSHYRVNVCRTS